MKGLGMRNISGLSISLVVLILLAACEKGTDQYSDHEHADASIGEHSHSAAGVAGPGTNFAENDLAYLTQLGLMRGHLYIGFQLYKEGYVEHAKTHMKHPKSELYTSLVSAFASRGTPGFASELEALAGVVEGEASLAQVDGAYKKLTDGIRANESVVANDAASLPERLKLASKLLTVAGEEYAIAVVNGEVKNAHEYQDALGFTFAAKRTIVGALPEGDAEKIAAEKAMALLETLSPLWPSVFPPSTLATDADQIYKVADQIGNLAVN